MAGRACPCGNHEIVGINYKRQNKMTIFRTTMLTLLLFVSVETFGQESDSSIDTARKAVTVENKIRFRKRMRFITNDQINQLKDGALLVRLQSKKKSITALRKIGKDHLADKIETKQRNYNVKIVSAFKTNFNFCPTYFFFSDFSQNIRDRQFDKVIFLSDSLFADSTTKFNQSNFLIAEFGTIEQDTAKYFSHNSYEPAGSWSLKPTSNYYGGPRMGYGALIIKSNQLIQLRRPFPYYVRTFDSLPIRRSPNKTVKKMNKKLYKFYKKNK